MESKSRFVDRIGASEKVRLPRLARLGGLGVAAGAMMLLGGCYGSYSYSSYRYEPACEPARVVVDDNYCEPRPVVVVNRYHHHSSYYRGHYHGGHYGHGYSGGYRSGRRW